MKPTRLARTITSSWSFISRSTVLIGRGGPSSRFASSSSSSPSPSNKSPKTEKKVVDRLSTVIDAVNDRKLPPELRGQRNAVRSSSPSLSYNYQIDNYMVFFSLYYLIRSEMLKFMIYQKERHNF